MPSPSSSQSSTTLAYSDEDFESYSDDFASESRRNSSVARSSAGDEEDSSVWSAPSSAPSSADAPSSTSTQQRSAPSSEARSSLSESVESYESAERQGAEEALPAAERFLSRRPDVVEDEEAVDAPTRVARVATGDLQRWCVAVVTGAEGRKPRVVASSAAAVDRIDRRACTALDLRRVPRAAEYGEFEGDDAWGEARSVLVDAGGRTRPRIRPGVLVETARLIALRTKLTRMHATVHDATVADFARRQGHLLAEKGSAFQFCSLTAARLRGVAATARVDGGAHAGSAALLSDPSAMVGALLAEGRAAREAAEATQRTGRLAEAVASCRSNEAAAPQLGNKIPEVDGHPLYAAMRETRAAVDEYYAALDTSPRRRDLRDRVRTMLAQGAGGGGGGGAAAAAAEEEEEDGAPDIFDRVRCGLPAYDADLDAMLRDYGDRPGGRSIQLAAAAPAAV